MRVELCVWGKEALQAAEGLPQLWEMESEVQDLRFLISCGGLVLQPSWSDASPQIRLGDKLLLRDWGSSSGTGAEGRQREKGRRPGGHTVSFAMRYQTCLGPCWLSVGSGEQWVWARGGDISRSPEALGELAVQTCAGVMPVLAGPVPSPTSRFV
ncbi:hypothetical protein P7K49_037971 [Saguinus oedipus]|uniref:Uncharacterized protein n=1 Tax=Saguinus oedipus TaxID=9490 RepID=A0ABQ9TDV1_SAGOE|nr:hypothetical protein P7K49_037971 [Saguinus oedipus]